MRPHRAGRYLRAGLPPHCGGIAVRAAPAAKEDQGEQVVAAAVEEVNNTPRMLPLVFDATRRQRNGGFDTKYSTSQGKGTARVAAATTAEHVKYVVPFDSTFSLSRGAGGRERGKRRRNSCNPQGKSNARFFPRFGMVLSRSCDPCVRQGER